jgi:ABC-type transport system substrate-binding protein/DNA-binding SARP family transcriptional activator/DNA-binding beta-propeller fold protein YncE
MRFCVLGPLEGYVDGHSVAVGGGRQRALLALLLVHAGEIVSRDRMIEELWDGSPPSSRSKSLDVYISRLRKAFRDAGAGEVLVTRAPGYVLHAGETDARQFEALAAEGHQALEAGDTERAVARLRDALALWRGSAYVEVGDEHWARPEAERLEELRLHATEDRIDAELALGGHAALVPELELLAAQHPSRERLVGQYMLALYRSGRQADALAAYRAARGYLVEELGLEPGRELRRLEAAVLAQDPALDLPRPEGARPVDAVAAGGRRTLRLGLAAAALLALAAIAAVAMVAGEDPPTGAIAANGAGALDPASGRLVSSVDVGSAPAGIASGAGRIWVTNGADGTITRIEPDGGHVDQTLAVGTSPAGVAAGAGAIWVANALEGSVSRIDPRAGQVVQTIRVGGRPVTLAVGEGAVWVADADGDAIVPLDPRRGVPRRRLGLSGSPGGVAVGFGSVWVSEPLAHTLVRIDPRSGRTQAEIAVGAGAGPVAAGAGAVWVVNTLDGTVSRINPNRDAVASTIPVGDAPTGVAAGGGGVWVTDSGGELVSVDPRTGGVERRYKVGAAPVGVALVGRTPWVAAGAPAGREHRGGTLRVQYSEFSEFDPALPYDVHPGIWRATGDGLVALVEAQGAAQLVPDLATTVPRPTNGGRTYAFRLRPGLRYSTGVPVRASDFRRQFERLFAAHSDLAGFYSALRGAAACARRPSGCDLSKGVVTHDAAGTVILRLAHPDPELLFKLTLPSGRPVPPGTPRAHVARGAVPSTGPYRTARFVPGRRLLLVRNERFREWSRAAQPDGYPDRIDIRMNDDPNERADAVLRGDADLAIEVASANIARLRVRFASLLRRHTQPHTAFFSFNVRRPPFDDVRARRAVNLAIDRADLARRIGGGGLSTPTCQILPANFPGHRDYCPWTRGSQDGRWHAPDIGRARALVRASGTAGSAVQVVVRRDDPTAPSAAAALATALRRIGYRPRLSSLSTGPAFERRIADPRRWSMTAGDWIADYPAPGNFLDYFLSCSNYHPEDPAGSSNGGGFCRADFDRLVTRAQALQLTNPIRAQQVWAKADRLAVDQAAWVPTVSTASVELLSRRAGHFTLDANSQPQIDQLWVR